jgi:hypothetical protein
MNQKGRGTCYSAVHGFWPVEELAELAEGPTVCGEVGKNGCLFAWNFSVKCQLYLHGGGEKE